MHNLKSTLNAIVMKATVLMLAVSITVNVPTLYVTAASVNTVNSSVQDVEPCFDDLEEGESEEF